MPKFIKKVTAQRCPIHQGVLQECGEQLVEHGYFSKSRIIEKLRYQAVEDSIRWDYIADFISDPHGSHGIELVPLAQKFFSSTRAQRLRASKGVDEKGQAINLGPYLAGGHGKKTAGYASVTFEGGLLALKRAMRFRGMNNGIGKAHKAFCDAVLRDKDQLDNNVVNLLEQQKAG